MKVNIKIDCSPEEARRFLGLPDVTEANAAYVDNMTNMMSGAGSAEQLQALSEKIAPMGQMGLNLFAQMMEAGAKTAFSGGADAEKPKK